MGWQGMGLHEFDEAQVAWLPQRVGSSVVILGAKPTIAVRTLDDYRRMM